jgi:hypothetical protein
MTFTSIPGLFSEQISLKNLSPGLSKQFLKANINRESNAAVNHLWNTAFITLLQLALFDPQIYEFFPPKAPTSEK